jgi:lactate permease
VPSIIPFLLTAALAFALFRAPAGTLRSRCAKRRPHRQTVIALFGALVFVNILMVGGESAPP